MSKFRTAAMGVGPLTQAFAVPVGQVYEVVSVMCHLTAAATTSENLTVTLDAVEGAAYDTKLYSVDLSAGAVVDMVWQPDVPLFLFGGDALDIAWANSNGRTWSLLVTMAEA